MCGRAHSVRHLSASVNVVPIKNQNAGLFLYTKLRTPILVMFQTEGFHVLVFLSCYTISNKTMPFGLANIFGKYSL